jgi:hypothetical protein
VGAVASTQFTFKLFFIQKNGWKKERRVSKGRHEKHATGLNFLPGKLYLAKVKYLRKYL